MSLLAFVGLLDEDTIEIDISVNVSLSALDHNVHGQPGLSVQLYRISRLAGRQSCVSEILESC